MRDYAVDSLDFAENDHFEGKVELVLHREVRGM
jgi:hypothetical protein